MNTFLGGIFGTATTKKPSAFEKRVAEVNELINEANRRKIEVTDTSSTWQSPMRYSPLKTSRGVLYVSYEELDLYDYAKGKGKKLMSKDGAWKVYETKSELFNLLWSWTVNDQGGTIYEDRDGNEKHEGFELYIRIAHDVHSAVPREQLTKPIFKNFIYKGKTDEKVYSLGI